MFKVIFPSDILNIIYEYADDVKLNQIYEKKDFLQELNFENYIKLFNLKNGIHINDVNITNHQPHDIQNSKNPENDSYEAAFIEIITQTHKHHLQIVCYPRFDIKLLDLVIGPKLHEILLNESTIVVTNGVFSTDYTRFLPS